MRRCVRLFLAPISRSLTPPSLVQIVEIVQTAVKHAPSAFNVQSSRAVILFGTHHETFWKVAVERFQAAVSPEIFSRLAPSLTTMKGAYG